MMESKAIQRSKWNLFSLWLTEGWRLATLNRNKYMFHKMLARASNQDSSWQSIPNLQMAYADVLWPQLTFDKCLLTRSDEQNMKDNLYFHQTLVCLSNRKPVSATGCFTTHTLISAHFLFVCCYRFCCFKILLFHGGTC